MLSANSNYDLYERHGGLQIIMKLKLSIVLKPKIKIVQKTTKLKFWKRKKVVGKGGGGVETLLILTTIKLNHQNGEWCNGNARARYTYNDGRLAAFALLLLGLGRSKCENVQYNKCLSNSSAQTITLLN